MKKNISILLFLLLLLPTSIFASEGATVESNAIAIDTIWVMIAAFMVFIMHAGFTCVEAGFTQSKNTINIIMKNFMTISIGVLVYYVTGFALMFGPSVGGLLGTKGFLLSSLNIFDFGIPTYGFFFFQAVFAATCATIVSGAMAERTKFHSYLIFTTKICSVSYPIIGHWTWNSEGFLYKIGFIDFAGSTVVHATGGFAALVGAIMVGPRLGKYTKSGKANAIPGHSIPLGAIGVLLLWFGWFGFNPGSTISGTTPAIASIAVTTILAGAAATVSSMGISWIKYGKPDVSLTMNGDLGGLVGITSGCASVDTNGALAIGFLAGIIMVYSVEFFDKVLKIDDPVGAISVHGITGGFGTIAVGFFAVDGGLLYGGGFGQLLTQIIGFSVSAAFSSVMALILFSIIKKTVGLRVTDKEQEEGLDIGEHGMVAYSNLDDKFTELTI